MKKANLLLLGEVARLLDCKPHQITYLLASRQVPEPALRIGGRRMFSAEDVERVRAAFKTTKGNYDQ